MRAPLALLAASLVVAGCSSGKEEPGGLPDPEDPGVIVFTGGTGDGELVHAIRPDGSGLRPLALREQCERPVEFSPDGRLAACWRYQPAGGERHLYVVRLDGSDAHRVPLPRGENIWLSISPDGSEFVFLHSGDQYGSDPYELWKARIEGEAAERLVGGDNGPASWSPDGKRLAFVRISSRSDCGGELVVMDANGGEQRVLAKESGGQPQWSPDAERIAFLDSGCEGSAIWTVPSDGGTPSLIVRDVFEGHVFAWSPNGKRIAFLRRAAPLGEGWTVRINVVSATGGRPRRIGPVVSDAPADVFWLPSAAAPPSR